MRNQSATDSQQQTVTIGGLAPSVNLLYQLPCPAHMPHPRWRKYSPRGSDGGPAADAPCVRGGVNEL